MLETPSPELKYPRTAVAADVVRALAGTALCTAVLVGASPPAWLAAVFGLAALLFLCFGLRCAARARHRFVLTDEALELVHRGVVLPWSGLRGLKLNYYSTRRDHRDGWLELQLRFPDGRVRVDSRLSGFSALLDTALSSAAAGGVDLDAASRRNIQSLGLVDPLADGEPARARALPDA